MPPTTPAQLLALLMRNSLLSDKHLNRLTHKLDTFESINDLANDLVQNELLTAWQTKQLLSGKKVPRVGQYRIIDALAKDEFGQRFVGVHKNLDRTVEVQMSFGKINDKVFVSSKKTIQKICSLDHPNLVHCQEIDRVNGRFVVIAEHLTGGTLADADLDQLAEVDVAKMVRQCLAGLMYAHARDVVHGELDRTKIVSCSAGFKICDFAIANLKRVSGEQANEQPDTETDLFELAEIGLELMDRIPGNESENRTSLLKIISDLGIIKVDRVADQLGRWIEENPKHKRGRRTGSMAVEPTEDTSERQIQSSESSEAKQEPGEQRNSESTPDSESTHRQPRPRKRKSPIVLFGGIAAAFAVIIVGLFAYWNLTHFPAVFANLNAETNSTFDAVDGALPTEETPKTNDNSPSDNEENPKTETPDLKTSADPYPKTAVDSDPMVVVDPRQKIDTDPPGSSEPPHPGSDLAAIESPKPAEKTVERQAEKSMEVPRAPFRDFTNHFELPALDDVNAIEICPLVIRPAFLLGATLFISPEAARKTGIFELRRSNEDKQRWLVSKRKSKTSDPVDVAAFWKTERAFCFRWLPAAQLDEDVNYLRNGALKLKTPDGQYGWLSLRSPVTIEGFQLADQMGTAEVKLEIPWLPSFKGLVIEITSFADRNIPSLCEPAFVQPRAPARMYFTSVQAEAFLWMEVSATQRKAIVLEAKLKINERGAIKALKPTALSQYKQANQLIAKQAAAMIKATKDQNVKQQYTTVQKNASKTAAAFAKYEKIIPKLKGKDIPVAVYLNVGEHHQLLIAKSPGVIGF